MVLANEVKNSGSHPQLGWRRLLPRVNGISVRDLIEAALKQWVCVGRGCPPTLRQHTHTLSSATIQPVTYIHVHVVHVGSGIRGWGWNAQCLIQLREVMYVDFKNVRVSFSICTPFHTHTHTHTHTASHVTTNTTTVHSRPPPPTSTPASGSPMRVPRRTVGAPVDPPPPPPSSQSPSHRDRGCITEATSSRRHLPKSISREWTPLDQVRGWTPLDQAREWSSSPFFI